MLRFISENGTGLGLRIENAETGEDISKQLCVNYGAQITLDELVRAKVELALVELNVVAGQTTWVTKHPLTGALTPIRSIAFADGTRVDFADDGTPSVSPPSQPLLDVADAETAEPIHPDHATIEKAFPVEGGPKS